MFVKSPKGNAYSFGLAREHFKKVYIKENPQADRSVPGPGRYDHTANIKQMAGVMYTCRPKTVKDSSFQNFTKGYPGPGTYELTATEDKNGFCYVSKYKSSTGTKINSITPGNVNAS